MRRLPRKILCRLCKREGEMVGEPETLRERAWAENQISDRSDSLAFAEMRDVSAHTAPLLHVIHIDAGERALLELFKLV